MTRNVRKSRSNNIEKRFLFDTFATVQTTNNKIYDRNVINIKEELKLRINFHIFCLSDRKAYTDSLHVYIRLYDIFKSKKNEQKTSKRAC